MFSIWTLILIMGLVAIGLLIWFVFIRPRQGKTNTWKADPAKENVAKAPRAEPEFQVGASKPSKSRDLSGVIEAYQAYTADGGKSPMKLYSLQGENAQFSSRPLADAELARIGCSRQEWDRLMAIQ